jgi:hypothetical protein
LSRDTHCNEVLFHGRKTLATLFRTFHQLFDTYHPLRKIHLLSKLGKIRLNFRVLKVHLSTAVVDQLRLKRSVVDEGRHHVPIAVDLQDEATLPSAGSNDVNKFVCLGRQELAPDIRACLAHDWLAAHIVEFENEFSLSYGEFTPGRSIISPDNTALI